MKPIDEIAHLRFADDVFPVVEALQRRGKVMAVPAREVYEDAPDGWFVVCMEFDTTQTPADLIELTTEIIAESADMDAELLSMRVEPVETGMVVTFFKLRGLAQSVH